MGLFEILGVLGTVSSVSFSTYKYGNFFSRKRMFYKLAKFILTKIFNEVKDVEKIKDLAKTLKEKFSKKTYKELKTFILDLADLEKKQKKYNFDKFFRENKEQILKNVESLKEYFIKRQIVEEFSLFVFARLNDTHVSIEFYKALQDKIIEDAVLNTKMTTQGLIDILEDVYKTTADVDIQNFTTIEKNFNKNKQELLGILTQTYENEDKDNKHKRRFINFLKENILAMKLTKEMIKGVANITSKDASKNVKEALGSANSSDKSSIGSGANDFLSQLEQFKQQLK